jgi:hypothetical protein
MSNIAQCHVIFYVFSVARTYIHLLFPLLGTKVVATQSKPSGRYIYDLWIFDWKLSISNAFYPQTMGNIQHNVRYQVSIISCGMLHREALVRTDDSEELNVFLRSVRRLLVTASVVPM